MRDTAICSRFGIRLKPYVCQALITLCIATVSCGTVFSQTAAASTSQTKAQLAQNYGKLPLSFEANQGQTDHQVKFLSRGNGYSLFLTEKAAVLALSKADTTASHKIDVAGGPAQGSEEAVKSAKTDVVRMELSGGAAGVRVDGLEKLPGIANYFPGSDPASWHTKIPTYAKVKYSSVYPGIDLVYYGNQRQLEYDFVVSPNASPSVIELHFAGAKRLKLMPEGDLAVIASNGEITFHKPVVYQMKDGMRFPVEGSFQLQANNSIRFSLGKYDHTRELVIDPVLAYSTYLGGSNTDDIFAIAVDSSGNAYVTGETNSTSGTGLFPTTSKSYQPSPDSICCGTQTQAFVTKLNATGTALIYSTFLGTGNNHGRAITLDSSGDAYITGYTGSAFPTTPRVYQGSIGGNTTAFITELGPTGSTLIASTFLGANPFSVGLGIALDSSGDVFVTGQANSGCCNTFPTTTGAYQTSNGAPSSVFVSRLSADFVTLAYSTLIGGTNGGGDAGTAIALDASDNAYIVGYAGSSNYPTTSDAYQKVNNTAKNTTDPAPGDNVIVSKVNPKGSALLYSTYIGGSGSYDAAHSLSYYDSGRGIRLDAAGNIYIAGTTGSSNFPTTKGAFQTKNPEVANGGYQAGFVTKFNPTLSALVYSTYLGGTDGSADSINGLALDSDGNAYVTGATSSESFPVTAGAYQSANPGADALAASPFLTKFNATGTAQLYSTYFGGDNGDQANGIAVDAYGNAYLCGFTDSTDFPVTTGVFQKTNNATSFTGWIAKFAEFSGELTPTTTTLKGAPTPQSLGVPVTFTATVSPTGTGTVVFTVDGASTATTTVTGGEASFTISSLTVGTHTIVASYSGSATLAPSSSASFVETIVPPVVATPIFTPAAGTYTSTEDISIAEATSGATIYYTLDGSTPTISSLKYAGPIFVNSPTIINAIAIANGYTESDVASATYSVVGSPSALASAATGIATPKATLNATVDTMGLAGSYYFRYGKSATALTLTTPTTTLGATTSPVKISAALTTLVTKTTYYFQVVVTTAGGSASGAVLSFTTN
jgi:hypothetical protein